MFKVFHVIFWGFLLQALNVYAVDLAGKWTLLYKNENQEVVEETWEFLPTNNLCFSNTPLYWVKGSYFGFELWAASVVEHEGRTFMVWQMKKGARIDSEVNRVLKVEDDVIFLGEDLDDNHVGRMVKEIDF